jgi:hypothetical protein
MSAPPPIHSMMFDLASARPGASARVTPDEAERAVIARALDLASLGRLDVIFEISGGRGEWRLSGHIDAEGEQVCGVTLAPLAFRISEPFSLWLVQGDQAPVGEDGVLELSPDDEGPDLIDSPRVDLGVYAVEQLALRLDPFPRAPGAVFEAPESEAPPSPFAVLARLRDQD